MKPWPCADAHPVARIVSQRLQIERYVLEGDSGRVLAFGPEHRSGTAIPGELGNSVIGGGHRDAHFEFLRELRVNDRVLVEKRDGTRVEYRVTTTTIVDKSDASVLAETTSPVLTLITCYPSMRSLPEDR